MTVEKSKPKQLLRAIATGANSAMNQSQFLAIISNSLKAWEESHLHGAVSYTHLRAHETREDLVCRLLLEKKNVGHRLCFGENGSGKMR